MKDIIENIEVARSYSRKKNLGNYETMDFFASYKAVLKNGATEEEINQVSQVLAEKAENDVEDKIDPSKAITRRQTNSELRAKIATLTKQLETLEEKFNLIKPF